MSREAEPFIAVGALLARATDLDTAARLVQAYALDPGETNRAALAAIGVDTDDARDFLRLLPRDPAAVEQVCELARAWTLGRTSLPSTPTWQPVVTSGEVDAHGIDRMTAETMIGLIVGARVSLRIFSPFLDARGLDVLTIALVAATRRGVQTAIGYAHRGNRGNAIDQLKRRIRDNGDPDMLLTVSIESNRPFPHLKLISADGERAYIGSANLTWPALTSNAEIGALVAGDPVSALDQWFDRLITPPVRVATRSNE